MSAALPGVALRVTRTAAGRRALQVVLLVGGLFVLGLLCGEQARAADGVGATPTEVVRSVEGSTERLVTNLTNPVGQAAKDAQRASDQQTGERSAEPNPPTSPNVSTPPSDSSPSSTSSEPAGPGLPKAITPVTDGVQRVVRPVTERVVRPVTEQVVRPVTERVVRPVTGRVVPPVAEGVVRPIGDLVDGITGGVTEPPPSSPSLPPSQWWPSWPQLPTLPGLPELPGLPAVPGQTLPVGTAPQQPGGATDEHGAAGREAEEKARDEGTGAYGPQFGGGSAVDGADVDHAADQADDARAVQAPARQAPDGGSDGDPTGSSGHRSAVDNGSPRHGDAQAVALNERAQLRLVPGAAADVTAAGTRDRHRDIPAFPG
ncbi:hypothetical protein [Streptomyces sp. NPDC050704]|uniref:hypothetical protein n=1 Tax=Streptomyces sp. NPDC050704 TaxID=3157219 RepID=UPI00343FF3C6